MLRGIRRVLGAAVCLAPIMLIACAPLEGNAASQSQEESTGVARSELTLDFCASAPAHVSLNPSAYTLDNGDNLHTSTNAAYAYKGGCDRFLVDSYVDSSDLGYYPGVLLNGDAYDLPSSSSLGGLMPANAIDCAQFRLYVTFYSKNINDSTFTKLQGSSNGGVWKTSDGPAHCELNALPNTLPALPEYVAKPPSDGSTKIFRTAVKAVLRGSAQQVSVRLSSWTPPPK